MTSSKSIMLFETDNYGVRLEYNKDFAIVHLPFVNKITKGVVEEMRLKLEEWDEFFNVVGYKAIWAALDPNNILMIKLATLLGFQLIGHADGMSIFKYGEK